MASPDPRTQNRTDQAWARCKGWITEIEGSPTIALFTNAPVASLYPAFQSIARVSENFRLTAIPADHPDSPLYISLEAFPSNLTLLQENKLAELSANYTAKTGSVELDFHLVIFPLNDQKVALELFWWNDQVFLDETDPYLQFKSLLSYFFELQSLFSAPELFLSPETGEDPGQALDSWVDL